MILEVELQSKIYLYMSVILKKMLWTNFLKENLLEATQLISWTQILLVLMLYILFILSQDLVLNQLKE
jgi:hypothetical protein